MKKSNSAKSGPASGWKSQHFLTGLLIAALTIVSSLFILTEIGPGGDSREAAQAEATDQGFRSWGGNFYGQLGKGDSGAGTNSNTPQSVSIAPLNTVDVAGGGFHSCALTSAGGVKCWGRNNFGQLGGSGLCEDNLTACTSNTDCAAIGTGSCRSNTPGDVGGGLTSGVLAVTSGLSHSCAMGDFDGNALNGNEVKCWGDNGAGQLGDKKVCGATCDTPVDVCADAACGSNLSGVSAISAGGLHTCALITGGGVKCWGRNQEGQLGDNKACGSFCDTPVDVSGLTSGVTAIGAGGVHTCALTTAGGVKCWGHNGSGQLGDGQKDCGISGINCLTPQDVCATGTTAFPCAVGDQLSSVTDLELGINHTCALTTGGGAKCWGSNLAGRLGDGTTLQRNIPVDVSGLTSGVSTISAGGAHTCAFTTSGGAKCWGLNNVGQLGDGANISQPHRERLLFPSHKHLEESNN